jgi:Na+/proline symporter
MVIINRPGELMVIVGLVAAFAVGGLVELIWPNANKAVAVGCAVYFLVTISTDLVYRWTHFRERRRLRFVHPFTGGMVFFVPIWITSVAPFVVAPIMLILDPPKKVPPPRVALSPPAIRLEYQCNIVSSARPA